MLRSAVIILCVLVSSSGAMAMTITLDPDDYASGTDLSSVSPYLTLSTTGGAPVYSAPIFPVLDRGTPEGISDTGPFKDRVFSPDSEKNQEWWAWPREFGVELDPYDPNEWSKDPYALQISFNSPVTYISLLALETNADCCPTSDPGDMFVYDSANNLISVYPFAPDGVGSGSIGDAFGYETAYSTVAFSHPDIATVILGGDSEPVTLDLLTARTQPVPEPATIILLGSGLVGIAGYARKKLKR